MAPTWRSIPTEAGASSGSVSPSTVTTCSGKIVGGPASSGTMSSAAASRPGWAPVSATGVYIKTATRR